jgi:hypothetical protein
VLRKPAVMLAQSGSLERVASDTWQVASRLSVVCFSYLLIMELPHEGGSNAKK